MMKYLLFFITLFSINYSGESLKCWFCTPSVKPQCDNTFVESNLTIKECNYNNSYPACRTMTSLLSNGELRVLLRDCSRKITYRSEFMAQDASKTGDLYVVESRTHYCDTDLCNSAKSIYFHFGIAFVAIISFLCLI